MTSKVYKEDERLITACVEGSSHDWARFMRRYNGQIHFTVSATCVKYGVRSYDGDDMAAHVYEKLLEDNYRRLRAWRGQSSFGTYLALVTRNLSIDYIKKNHKGRRVEHGGDLDAWLESMPKTSGRPSQLDTEALRAAIEALPAKQKMIMKLRLKGKTLRDIAAIMNIPKGSVFGENARALETLRKRLEGGRAPGEKPDRRNHELS